MTVKSIIIFLIIVICSCSNNRQQKKFNQESMELDKKAADLLMRGEPDSALLLLEKALLIDSTYFPANNLIASIYLDKNLPDSAIIQLEKVLKLKPDFAEVWSGLGMLYDNKGDTMRAKRYYEKSVTLYTARIENPDNKARQDYTRANRLNRAFSKILAGQVQKGRNEAIQLKREDSTNFDTIIINELLTKTRQEILNDYTKK